MPELPLADPWRSIFDAIALPLAVVRNDGLLVQLNRAARTLAALPPSTDTPDRLTGLGPGEPWRATDELALKAASHEGPLHATVREPVGGTTWEIAAFPTRPADGTGPLVTLVLRDITEVISLQESVVRNQTMAALGKLVGGVAHEVRSPLFGISATLDAFEARFGPNAEHQRYFENLRRELARMNDLMRDLVELGRPAMAPKRLEPLGGVVEQAIGAVREEAVRRLVAVRSRLEAGEATLRVNADRRRLVQSLTHLLANAIQHSPPSQEVTIAAGIGGRGSLRDVTITIDDSGPGIRPEDLSRVGEPFFTRRPGGTGLGLAIVQRIMEDHGGTVSLGNRPEGGTRARITLPAEPEAGEDTA